MFQSPSQYGLSALLAPAFFWLVARGAYFSIHGTREDVALLGRDEIDLFNLRPLYRYGRGALRISLVWIVGISLGLPFVVDLDFSVATLPFLAATLLLATMTFLLPVRGVHGRIREVKRSQLAALDADLGGVREAALAGEPAAQSRMSFLLDYRAHLESVREWPFERSTLLRFAFYLLIPVASWFAGAFVERLVNAALD